MEQGNQQSQAANSQQAGAPKITEEAMLMIMALHAESAERLGGEE